MARPTSRGCGSCSARSEAAGGVSTAAAPGDSAQVDTESRAHAGDHMALRLWLRLLACTNLVEAPLRTRLREQFRVRCRAST